MPGYIKGSSKLEEFKRILKEQIKNNKYIEGDKLPSVRRFAEDFKLNKTTVNMAINSLAAEGLLRIERGSGTFVESPASLAYEMPVANIIGILIPGINTRFYPGIVRGAEDVCSEKGYSVLLGNCDTDHEKEKSYMASFRKSGVAGFIIAPSLNSSKNTYYSLLREKRVPVVFTDSIIENFDSDLIKTDNLSAGAEIAEILMRNGYFNIAYLTGKWKAEGIRERLFGFKTALEDSGENINLSEITCEYNIESCAGAVAERLRGTTVDAIFCPSETLAPGLFKAILATEMGEFTATVSFSDREELREPLPKTLLVIQKRLQIGKSAAEFLFRRIQAGMSGRPASPGQTLLIKPEIINNLK